MPEDAGDAARAAEDGGGDGATTDGGGAGLVDCFGTLRNVFLCDAFDLPNIAVPPWVLDVSPPNDTASAELATSPIAHLSGGRAADSYVGGAPGTKTAKARWTRPGGSPGPLAFQLNVYIPSDAWAVGDSPEFAALYSAAGPIGVLKFLANGSGANGRLTLTNGSGSVDLGPVSVDFWSCLEIVADGTSLTAFRGPIKKGSLPAAQLPSVAEFGISTALNNKVFYFDDVVLAPNGIGCLHE